MSGFVVSLKLFSLSKILLHLFVTKLFYGIVVDIDVDIDIVDCCAPRDINNMFMQIMDVI